LAPEEPPAEAAPEELPTEPAPAWLPIERVQRSPDSQPGQVLVDSDPATVWFANGAGQPLAMFVLDLGQETAFSQIRWLAGDAGLSGDLYLSISSDGEQWIDLDPTTAVVAGDGWSQLDTPATARYTVSLLQQYRRGLARRDCRNRIMPDRGQQRWGTGGE